MKYLKLFETENDRTSYENGESYIEPYVSYVEGDNSVHYNKPKFFCKLTLSDDSIVEIEGSGELTSTMISSYKNTLVSAEIGNLCSSIGIGAFSICSSLSNVTIGNGVTSIGGGAFNACTSLTSIIIPDSVTSIGGGAFNSCTNLTSITIGNGVTSIGNSAFYQCSSLTSVTIGSGVTSIGEGAFQGCINLSTITSHIMNAPSVNGGTFNGVKNGGTLYVPIGSSGYETWMNDQGNLGSFGWTKVEQ